MKQCGCGRRYSWLTWQVLEPPPAGQYGMEYEEDDGTPVTLEFKNCVCGSTLATELKGKRK